MASAQVLRKQEHLEAGKKKLEEFRRKKAAEKAKRAASTTDGAAQKKQSPDTERVSLSDSSGLATSDGLAEGHLGKNKTDDSKSDFNYFSNTNAKSSFLESNNNTSSSVQENSYLNIEEYNPDVDSKELSSAGYIYDNRKDGEASSDPVDPSLGNDHSLVHQMWSTQQKGRAYNDSIYHGLDAHQSTYSNGLEKYPSLGNSGTTAAFTTDNLSKTFVGSLLQEKLDSNGHGINSQTSSPYQESVHSTTSPADSAFGVGQFPKLSGAGDRNYATQLASDYKYADYDSDTRSSSNHTASSPLAYGRRSRPSFLDSLQISRGPSSSPPIFEAANADSSNSKVYPMDSFGSFVSQRPVNSSILHGEKGIGRLNHGMEDKPDFFSQKQNEDFAALEQHIEDLTQEKFSLQRALEASRALAESLASENSALTDSFNQQGSVVSQLKHDLEKLQEEIRAHLVELEAVKLEYANAQMECNAADERAKLLASELIALEEKGLRLRSNELKLERELENSEAEISSYRKKISSLEKDRQDLQSTVNALQEEKKLLQSKLRKSTVSVKDITDQRASDSKKDVSTSTEDLDIKTFMQASDSENFGASSLGDDASSSQFPHETLLLNLEGLALTIPSEQIRMIENINSLIAELAMEKDQLIQALTEESSRSSKLSELNKELTRKLEAQTQRLELLTAQSMANGNIQPRQPNSHTRHDDMTYADEGDEVVERVLGWIMKLFPGGPSRRRTGKHL